MLPRAAAVICRVEDCGLGLPARNLAPMSSCLLLGSDHEKYGEYEIRVVAEELACGISVGADARSPSRSSKGHPNEDGVLAVATERHFAVAVADAHFGRESSHDLLKALQKAFSHVPETPDQLDDIFRDFAGRRAGRRKSSETTLAIAVYDRLFRQGFGISWGDSSIALAPPDEYPRVINERSGSFVSLAVPRSLSLATVRRFTFVGNPGDLLLAYTDGVNECDYRGPDTSITTHVMRELLADCGQDPKLFLERVIPLALKGVGGNPGGQDNIAIAAAQL